MSHPEWERIKEIFHAARPRSGTERERVLDELCGDDDELRERVLGLLAADEEGASLLDSRELGGPGVEPPAANSLPGGSIVEGPGDRIGPYKLLQEIGEGGFGVVYMAEQQEPIRRRVALKVIKPGMDTKQVIARFEAERQALAMMDHPNIAKVLDAGTTPSGRPYFVMELVKGIPITDYCDDHTLDTRERLDLFTDVCRAVEHAHQAGIIHRDLKPSNVLVTLHDGTPIPKVIDFGVAKATRARLTESTLFTEFHQFVGTPTYMSPEQAAYEGLEVDIRSDVYSLGVLLYELLTGTTPFETSAMKRAAYFEVLRILKEEEPPKPSTRVSTMGGKSEMHARHRGADPNALAKMLRGDLDWIIMKALEKDRRRRYASASDMAADVARYFEQKPIHARPPSRLYRAQKLLKRRRGRFAAAAVLLLALGVDVGYVTWQRSQMALSSAPTTFAGPVSELLVSSEDAGACFFFGQPSPDGTRILHTDWCTGSLYVRDLAAGTMEFVTEYTFQGAEWLPDGQSISVAPGGPFDSPTIIDLETGASEVPASFAGINLDPEDWAPDGDHITGTVVDERGARSTVLMSLTSGARTELAEGGGGASFSPDGRYVLFSDDPGGDQDLFVLEVQSGERWALLDTSEDVGGALWSPEGTTVVYQNASGLWAIPVADGRTTGQPRLVLRDEVYPLEWNEHGFYYSVYNVVTEIQRVGIDPEDGRVVTGELEPVALPDAHLDAVKLRWAPDESRAAVAARYGGGIHVMQDGVTTSFAVESASQALEKIWWSRDGREVLFTNIFWAQPDRSSQTVFALDVESGHVRKLFPEVPGIARIHVSPDGNSMVWVRLDPDPKAAHSLTDLVISELGETEGQVLARPNEYGPLSGRADQPVFSPDGSWILFVRNALHDPTGGPYSLWAIRPDGSDERMLAEAPFLTSAVWDPTSRAIAYRTVDDESNKEVHVVSVEDGTSYRIEGFDDIEEDGLLDWSPDGRWLAVRQTTGRWELWVNRDVLGGSSE